MEQEGLGYYLDKMAPNENIERAKNDLRQVLRLEVCSTLQHTATHCNMLQHAATHCNSLQHTAKRCITLQHTATHCIKLATHCNTPATHLQQTCNTMQILSRQNGAKRKS